jgi:hypothetical protein
MISETMREMGSAGAARHALWTRRHLLRWRQQFYRSGIFRHIARNYLKVGALEWYVFRHLRTADRINRRWALIARLLKH